MITSHVSGLPPLAQHWGEDESGLIVARSLSHLVIDTLAFARESRVAEGSVAVADMPRVFELLGESKTPVPEFECSLSGWRDKKGRSWLRLQLKGGLDLICQRCLTAMPFALNVDTELQVIAPGEAWPDETLDDGALSLGADAIAASAEQRVAELLEEEVLLALPVAPRHDENFAVCVPPAHDDGKQSVSPFAALAKLKKH